MKRIITSFLVFSSALLNLAKAQSDMSSIHEGHNHASDEPCMFDQRHKKMMQQNNEYKKAIEFNEHLIQKIITEQQLNKKAMPPVYTIPVVVHILHLGEAVGSGTNISDAQIQSAITNMTNRYRGTVGSSVDVEIEFQLAIRGPNCTSTSGINRVDLSGFCDSGDCYGTVGITSLNEVAVKAQSKWPNGEYYNIWVVSEIDNNAGGSGVQGYAYFPGASSDYDGTVILYNAFGYDPGQVLGYNLKTYTDENETMTHEMGHGLNLYHTFQDACYTETDCATQGDRLCDTRPHTQANCSATTSCSGGGTQSNSINNYMSYCNSTSLFTADGVTRMRAALEGTRASLLSSAALTPLSGSAPSSSVTCSPNTTDLANSYGMGVFGLTIGATSYSSSGAVAEGGFKTAWCNNFSLNTSTNYSITVTTGALNNEDVRVYIDYNNDGDFVDAGELIYSSNNILQTHTSSFTTPASPTTGTPLWIRVISDWAGNTISGPCYTAQYGQAEDFSVTISGGAMSRENIMLEALNNGATNVIKWSLLEEDNSIDFFEIERMTDYSSWEKLDDVVFQQDKNIYVFNDNQFIKNNNYYRIKVNHTNKATFYSKTVVVSNNSTTKKIKSIFNIYGQEISLESKGLKILLYNDGTTEKFFNNF